jgi:mono/diheme cytochrome c family protein
LKSFIVGIVIGVLVVPLMVYAYFAWGFAPVATSASAMPFEKTLASKALNARIKKEMPKTVPIAADEANYLAGVQTYRQNCAVCHGLPMEAPTAISKGMFPKPPQLFRGKGVTDDEPGETYWKVTNGIRLSGMPGFSPSLSSTQMWQVSLLLANADKLPEAAKVALASASAQAPSAGQGVSGAQP